ncbi:MAG: hypothetical protein HW419_4407 [Deltaproteobacteria bacterium]|nr:hypothetical protein [Deltaproteobacteria bacterium]
MLRAGHEKEQRIAAEHQRERHLFAFAKIFLSVHVAMLARNHEQTHGFLVLNHRPVAARIDPFFVRVHGDRITAGADVAPAVVDMPDRRGKYFYIDISFLNDILKNRAAVDEYRRDVLRRLLIMLEVRVAQILLGQTLRKTECHRAALAGKSIDDHAKPLRTARHLVKYHRRPVIRRHDDIGREPDLFLPRRAEHGF